MLVIPYEYALQPENPMNQDTKNIVIGVGITATIIFMLYGCGSERDYYCVQWERPGVCLEYETGN